MVIFFFSFEFIFFLILALTGLATEAMRSFMNVLPDFIAGAVITIIAYGLHRLFQFLQKNRKSTLYNVCEAAMLCGITPRVMPHSIAALQCL